MRRGVRKIESCSYEHSRFDFDRQFKLAVDVSDVAIGAVLLQECSDGIEPPDLLFLAQFDYGPNELRHY